MIKILIDAYTEIEVSRNGWLSTDLFEKKGTALVILNEFEEKKHQWMIIISNGSGYSSNKFSEACPEQHKSLNSWMSGINCLFTEG